MTDMSACIRSDSGSMTREVLARRAQQAAAGFATLGVGPGDAIALLLRNDFAFFECLAAGPMCGAYVVPINWHSQSDQISYVLVDCGARVLVLHADLLSKVADCLPSGI